MMFSVITVTRNNLAGLQQTYESLAEQSLQAFEWLVVDGASTDGTPAFLEEIGADYTSEADDGIYDAMNKGIARARGFFVIFLNAGDRFAAPDTLEKLAGYVQELQETPQFIYGDGLEQRPDEKPAYKPARPYTQTGRGMFTHHQAMIYRRELIGDLRYDQRYAIAADYKFTLQYLDRCHTVIYAPFPLCLFESGGVSQQQAAQGRREQFEIRKELATVSPLRNHLIRGLQAIMWRLRKTAPGLYWKFKSAR